MAQGWDRLSTPDKLQRLEGLVRFFLLRKYGVYARRGVVHKVDHVCLCVTLRGALLRLRVWTSGMVSGFPANDFNVLLDPVEAWG